ncbi:MAG: hypothetical protein U0804_11670 [Gemmataceae bacterium]
MSGKPEVRVEIVGGRFHPGDELRGAFVLPGGPPADADSVEVSVLWHTSGKGTEDLGVIHFQDWTTAAGTLPELPNPGTFAVRLPNTPWSYDGTLVKIHWVARVRLRFGGAGEVVAEAPFVLAPRERP